MDESRAHKVIVVMPAYNAERTLERTIADIPFSHVDEIILIDDDSRDNTVALAKEIGSRHPTLTLSKEEYARDRERVLFTVGKLPRNKGYGGNQKECYRLALEHGADIVVMLHPDYQYDAKLIKYFVEFIRDGYFHVMLGSRIRSREEALAGGMPAYKYMANRALSFMQNLATGRVLSEWHTGMRAYSSDVLRAIDFGRYSDDFVFDTQVLFGIVEKGYAIGDIPVPVRYFEEASSINFKRSLRYGFLTVWETVQYLKRKFFASSYGQVFCYLVAGGSGFLANIASFAVLVYVASVWYIAASVMAFAIGGVVSFVLQKFWTFRDRGTEGLWRQISLYTLLACFNVVINACILFVLVEELHMEKIVAEIISNGLVAIWSFFIYKHVTFKSRPVSTTALGAS